MLTNEIKAKLDQDPLNLHLLNKLQKDDEEIVKYAVSINGYALKFASRRLRDDIDIVEIACKNSKLAFNFATKRLKDDLESVKRICSIEPTAISYVSRELRAHPDLLSISYTNNQGPMQSIGRLLKSDYEFAKKSVESNGRSLLTFKYDLHNNVTLAKIAAKTYGMILAHLSKSNRAHYEIVNNAVSNDGLALQFASDDLRKNIEIVKTACKQNYLAIEYAHEEIISNYNIVNNLLSSIFNTTDDELLEKYYPLHMILAKKKNLSWKEISYKTELPRHLPCCIVLNSTFQEEKKIRIETSNKWIRERAAIYKAQWFKIGRSGDVEFCSGYIAHKYIYFGKGDTIEEAILNLHYLISKSPIHLAGSTPTTITFTNSMGLDFRVPPSKEKRIYKKKTISEDITPE